jgi:hypothetical protein
MRKFSLAEKLGLTILVLQVAQIVETIIRHFA